MNLARTGSIGVLALIVALGFAVSAQADPVCDVLWTFNGNTLDSSSGSLNNGTVSTGTLTYVSTTINGVSQQAAVFNGSGTTGTGVTNSNASNLPVLANQAWTLNMWLNLSAPITGNVFIGGFGNPNGPTGTNRDLMAYTGATYPDKFYFWGYGADSSANAAYNYSGNNTWSMFTVTSDGAGDINMYVNDTLVQTATGINTLATAPNKLQAGFADWQNQYNGKMADFSVWTGSMGTAQINRLYVNPLANTLSSGNCTWTGSATNEWSTNIIGGRKNWTSGGIPTEYADNYAVLFDDTAGTASTVDIKSTNVNPYSVTFNNNAVNYTLQSSGGFGIIGTGTLLKSGSGTLTISSSNSYTGGTSVGRRRARHQQRLQPGAVSGDLPSTAPGYRPPAASLSSRIMGLGDSGGTVDTQGNSSALNGAISGNGGLTKIGGGVDSRQHQQLQRRHHARRRHAQFRQQRRADRGQQDRLRRRHLAVEWHQHSGHFQQRRRHPQRPGGHPRHQRQLRDLP